MIKRSFISLLLALFAYLPSMAETSTDEAKALVKKYVADSLSEFTTTLKVFMAPEDLTQIEFYYRPSFEIPSSVYTFYVDPTPEADLVHRVRVVFISKETGKIGTLYSGMPVKNISNWELIQGSDIIDFNDGSKHGEHTIEGIYFDNLGLVQYGAFVNATNAVEKNSNDHSYAVIISGGINIEKNHIRYWNNSSLIYQLLVDVYGYKRENIYVLMAGGPVEDVFKNNFLYTNPYILDNFHFDLNGDGTDDVGYPATKKAISEVFDLLSNKLTTEDDLFVFTTDHGDMDGQICLWGEEELTPTEFTTEINKIKNVKSIAVTSSHCFGGALIEPFKAPGRTISSSTLLCELSNANGEGIDDLYSEFAFKWILGHINAKADTDGDGKVSMYEAFIYARENDHFYNNGEGGVNIYGYLHIEHPQYWSDNCLGSNQFLGEGGVSGSVPSEIVFDDNIESGEIIKSATKSITSKSNISGGDVKFYAGELVSLKSSFSVNGGALFQAKITNDIKCENSEVSDECDKYWKQGFYGPTIAFDANFDGLITESTNVNSNTITIYPNPTTGDLTITLGDKVANVTITDVLGNVIYTQQASGDLFVNMSSYNKGIYLVKVVTANDSYIEKVVLK